MMPKFLAESLEECRRRWVGPVWGQGRRSLLDMLKLTSRYRCQAGGGYWSLEYRVQVWAGVGSSETCPDPEVLAPSHALHHRLPGELVKTQMPAPPVSPDKVLIQ